MLNEVLAFLKVPTPSHWVKNAMPHLELLLLDHMNCEKKAASSALRLMFQYPANATLGKVMSRLAREELRHFEQIQRICIDRDISFRLVPASRYAQVLRAQCRTYEPARLVDFLLIGALIEARSCERFAALLKVLPADLHKFYSQLVQAEARHYEIYIRLAQDIAPEDVKKRVEELVSLENDLILSRDDDFRLHSGIPHKAFHKEAGAQ